jgi:hypothetical protein
MTDPDTNPKTEPETDPQPEARTGQDGRSGRRFELSPAQVTGSALAAMTGAFLASYLGTAGTVIGAAVGSLIATVGTTAYTWWLRRTSEVVKRTATQVRETGMGSTVVIPLLPGKGKAGSRTHGSQPGNESAPEPDSDAPTGAGPGDGPGDGSGDGPGSGDGDGDEPDRWAWARDRPWGKVALVAAAIALVVLGGLTVLEGITGKPLSSYTRGGHQTGTSVGHLVGNNPSPTPKPTKRGTTVTPTPTPSPTQSPITPTPLPTPTPTPTDLPTDSTAPTPTPSIGVTPTP